MSVQSPRLDRTIDDDLAVEIEAAIAALDGIEAVRLVPGHDRPIDELHIVVAPGREPKQTVRDVQSLLTAHLGVDVDRRVISVVQLSSDTGQLLREGVPRVGLEAVHIEVRGAETSVTVELVARDAAVLGCVGPIGDADLVLATAEATLDALDELLPGHTLRLQGVDITRVGPERVAVAAVRASGGRSQDLLTGSAAVRRHEPDAVARAVLDATNRLHRE